MWTDTTRGQYARASLALPSDLTDAEWAVLEPFFPLPSHVGRPRRRTGMGCPSVVPLLHSVNAALEVDLFRQINVEWQGDAINSGVGGAPDFMRASAYSPDGRSIVALPSTAKKGTISRLVGA